MPSWRCRDLPRATCFNRSRSRAWHDRLVLLRLREVAGARATISRTGYTGEDGFEIFVPPNAAGRVWDALLESGRSADVIPAGLGARDTLRLEASMRLCGNDIDESTTALEAGLGWMIGWSNERFIGREALQRQRARAYGRLVGFEMVDRGIARHGYPVVRSGEAIGVVTSGAQTPYSRRQSGWHTCRSTCRSWHRHRDRCSRPCRTGSCRAHAVL